MSFVLALSAMAFILLTVCYLLIDVYKVWSGAPFYYPGRFDSHALVTVCFVLVLCRYACTYAILCVLCTFMVLGCLVHPLCFSCETHFDPFNVLERKSICACLCKVLSGK